MKAEQYESQLKNGAKLLIKSFPGAQTMDFRYYIKSGSYFAPSDKFELPHLLEHLVLLGNKREPDSAKFAAKMERYTSAWGGVTNRYLNWFWFRKSPLNIEDFLEEATSQLIAPILSSKAVKEQAAVILQELNQDSADDSRLRFHYSYRSQLPALFPTYDDKKASLSVISPQDVSGYSKQRFVANNTGIVLAGDFDSSQASKLEARLNKLLSDYPEGHATSFVPAKADITPEQITEFSAQNPKLVNFVLTFAVAGRQVKDLATLRVLQAMWGGGKGSRMYQKVRPLGLTYSPQTLASLQYEFTGLAFWDQIVPDNLQRFLGAALSELAELSQGSFSEDELQRAKAFRIEREITAFPQPSDWSNVYGDDWVLGMGRPSPEELVGAIQKVTSQDIEAVASKYLPHWQLSIGNNHSADCDELVAHIRSSLRLT